MKPTIPGLLAIVLLTWPMAGQATSFTISLSESNVGDSGADWFGILEAPASGGGVASVSVVVHGVTYSFLATILPLQYFPSTMRDLKALS